MHRGLAQKRSSSHEACGSSKAGMRSRRHWSLRVVCSTCSATYSREPRGAPSMVSPCCSGEGVVADPHIGAEGIQVWRGDAGCIPNSGFATVELDAGVCVCVMSYTARTLSR